MSEKVSRYCNLYHPDLFTTYRDRYHNT